MSLQLGLSIPYKEEDDIISDLPDSVLHHILSFLTIKDTCITSLLSKRWKLISLLQHIFYLDEKHSRDSLPFIAARDKNLPFLLVHLKWCPNNEIVYAAIQRRLYNPTIHPSHSDCHISKSSAFLLTSKTLAFLKLKRITINQVSNVDLPSLKVLHMESITFADGEYLTKLLSGSPNLQELETKDLVVKKGCSLVWNDTNLSKLVRANISGRHIMFKQLHNVEHLRLHVTCPYPLHLMFDNLTHLELTLDIDHEWLGVGSFKWTWLNILLSHVPKLQTLIIDEVDTVNNFEDGSWKELHTVPACLLSHLTTCSLRNYCRLNCEIQFAKYILKNSTVLNTMTIQIAESVDTNTKLQTIKELSLCQRNSTACQLLFI
ncbi:putative F-box domain, FBD domain, leucine-rich repeat domain, L domain-containing protein [Medicago truncatula]|uniref:Putative F-box domain, FBD domain, leucine-rich repeat domain, L domain-containing protein n=1 Tax=Medicago truncatula TaxID=3880 RepID=A0A396H4C4_MEDTR|nr:F-box/FBD/LRR-repeat protein At4g26340 [Medicago truncatula]RHN45807.1 putative F-box domain, FBD domain, leucine-rich repeat domain, L domain-containing protein [Medicago truncatula]